MIQQPLPSCLLQEVCTLVLVDPEGSYRKLSQPAEQLRERGQGLLVSRVLTTDRLSLAPFQLFTNVLSTYWLYITLPLRNPNYKFLCRSLSLSPSFLISKPLPERASDPMHITVMFNNCSCTRSSDVISRHVICRSGN